MSKPATQVFADIVESAGIEYAFGMPGGCTPFVFDALYDKKDKIKCVLSRQEGAAACMADAVARLTGKPALVIGQGLWIGTNAGYGIVESYLAGTPMVIITETSDYANLALHAPYQCATGEYGSVDLPNIMRSMTKFTAYTTTPDEFVHGVQLAIKHATTGRPGPAAVVTRWGAAVGKVDPEKATPKLYPLDGHVRVSKPCMPPEDVERAADILIAAEKPVLVAGQGVRMAGAYDEVRELAELLGIPVATSFMGKSAIPETHDLAAGMMGRIGQATANACVSGADVILAVGTGLAPDNTLMLSTDYIKADKQKILHIDIEPLNVGFTFPVEMGIHAEAKGALGSITEAVKTKSPKVDVAARKEALAELRKKNNFFASPLFESNDSPIAPERVVAEMNTLVKEDDLLVLDAGNNRMFFSKHFRTKGAGQLLGAGGAAGIGWGVPAACAAQMCRPGRRVICVCGDGGMLLNLGTLETARQFKLPLTYVVLNNASLGNVNDFVAHDRRNITEYDYPNFEGIAAALEYTTMKVEQPEDLKPALEKALDSDGPALVDIHTARSPHFTLMM